ncbi:MAG: c-type cytochrome [Acidobacteriota bacterium]|nr:c-type cytochrome [Acidobacteriota bacterium]
MRGALKIGLVAAAVLSLVCALLFARMLRYGLSAHDEPTTIEATIASRMRRWAVPADLREVTNPVPLTPEVLEKAKAHFADHCASCHGNDGKGQTAIGKHLYPKAPDMAAAKTQALSDGELFATIENGIRLTGMPGWGDGTAESAYGSWTLVHLIRHIPKITADEVAEMERMNPVSPSEMEERQSEEKFLEGADEKAGAHATHAK